MAKQLFPKGLITVKVDGIEYLAEYIGKQEGFECCVCGKGGNCYTFNIFESEEDYERGAYGTWGYGRAFKQSNVNCRLTAVFYFHFPPMGNGGLMGGIYEGNI